VFESYPPRSTKSPADGRKGFALCGIEYARRHGNYTGAGRKRPGKRRMEPRLQSSLIYTTGATTGISTRSIPHKAETFRPSAGDFVDRGGYDSTPDTIRIPGKHPVEQMHRSRVRDQSCHRLPGYQHGLTAMRRCVSARKSSTSSPSVSRGERLEQRKRPRGRYAQPQVLQGGIGHAGGFSRPAELQSKLAKVRPLASGVRTSAAPNSRGAGAPHAGVRDKADRRRSGRPLCARTRLRHGLDQPGAEARVIGAEAVEASRERVAMLQ